MKMEALSLLTIKHPNQVHFLNTAWSYATISCLLKMSTEEMFQVLEYFLQKMEN